MDAYLIKHSPTKYEHGHVEETPFGWEQRYERVDGHVKQGKVVSKYNFKIFCFQIHAQSKIR